MRLWPMVLRAVSLPTDTGRYLTGASLTLGAEAAAADPTGESLVFLGWSTDRTKAARIYARGEQVTAPSTSRASSSGWTAQT